MALPKALSPTAFLPSFLRRELDLTAPIAIGKKGSAAKYVQERLTLAGFGLKIDSDFGSATETQLKNFQRSKGLRQTGIYDAAEHDLLTKPFVDAINPIGGPPAANLGALTVAVAKRHIAQHPVEVGGANAGPWVRMYMDGQEGPDWLWCAGFVFFMMNQAASQLGVPPPMARAVGVDVIADRAKAGGQFLSERTAATPAGLAKIKPGSFFMVRAEGSSSHYIHTGIVSTASAASFGTCEGNSNDDGSSNGFEALERVRNYGRKDFVVW